MELGLDRTFWQTIFRMANLIVTGSENQLSTDVAEFFLKNGNTVRAMYAHCVDAFEETDERFKQAIIPDSVPMSK